MERVRLQLGDITTARVDAIVNAANETMLGGGGVDGAIHRAAGTALIEACKQVPAVNGTRCPTGEARITTAGELPARYVIHTVGPVYSRAAKPAALLASAYHSSYQLALAHECHSLAVPAISCGVYGYPLREAARIALAISREDQYRDLAICFYLFNQAIYHEWAAVLEQLKG